MVTKSSFGEYELFTIGGQELSVSVTALGATVTSLRYRGRETVPAYESPEGYLAGTAYLGAAIGRYGNRIGGARFILNGKTYRLIPNEGRNQLHGGPNSYDRRIWHAEEREDAVRFTLLSPDGDNGFPGRLTAAVTYSVVGNTLRLDFEGESDADTVYAPTSHMYFDLGGGKNCLDAQLLMNADRYLEVDDELIPTRLTTAQGRFDFRSMRQVAEDYDHCFVLNGQHACTLRDGGIDMELWTDFPALQVYTGSHLAAPLAVNQGIALEPEFYPDSPNRPDFPTTTLRAGDHFHRWAEYRFRDTE